MREIRIYQAGEYTIGQELELTASAAQHVAVVLRMKVGDKLTVFNGDNTEFDASLVTIKKKQAWVLLNSMQKINRESPLQIHLGQGISKGERMEWVIQKATELGVASITPLITERCVVKLDKERLEKKIQQWQAIAIAACEQSGRNKVPKVHSPVYFEQFLSMTKMESKFILHTQEAKSWRDYSFNTAELALLIGPEGGFSPQEVSLAQENHYLPLSLGPRILRTETAAISALSLLQAVGGDL